MAALLQAGAHACSTRAVPARVAGLALGSGVHPVAVCTGPSCTAAEAAWATATAKKQQCRQRSRQHATGGRRQGAQTPASSAWLPRALAGPCTIGAACSLPHAAGQAPTIASSGARHAPPRTGAQHRGRPSEGRRGSYSQARGHRARRFCRPGSPGVTPGRPRPPSGPACGAVPSSGGPGALPATWTGAACVPTRTGPPEGQSAVQLSAHGIPARGPMPAADVRAWPPAVAKALAVRSCRAPRSWPAHGHPRTVSTGTQPGRLRRTCKSAGHQRWPASTPARRSEASFALWLSPLRILARGSSLASRVQPPVGIQPQRGHAQ